MKPLSILVLFLCAFVACKSATDSAAKADAQPMDDLIVVDQYPGEGFGYQTLDLAFAAFVDTTSGIEVLASGFQWSEGPVWIPAINSLLFTDVPNNIIYRWGKAGPDRPVSGAILTHDELTAKGTIVGVDTFLYPSGYFDNPAIKGEAGANGLILDSNGFLLMVQHGERQVARFKRPLTEVVSGSFAFAKTDFESVTDSYKGKKFNSPNDLILADNGDLYFTDPTYGVDKTFGEDARELDFAGVYRVKSGSSTAELLYSSLLRPNGVVMTPDNKHFIVASSEAQRSLWMKCDARPEPIADEERCKLFADVTSLRSDQNPGNCDGMVMHSSGIMLATGPGGVLCFSESGKHLGTIRTGRPTANVTLGGPDGKDIFITANQLLLRARLK